MKNVLTILISVSVILTLYNCTPDSNPPAPLPNPTNPPTGGGLATCSDGIKNGDETGVDCGGSCSPCGTVNNCINSNLSYGSVTDIDGNEYPTIMIGNQEWMAQNLRTTKFSNGDIILNATSQTDWLDFTIPNNPKWCYYENVLQNDIIYGKLYNYYAVSDSRNICPSGWYVPGIGEWEALMYVNDSLYYLNTGSGVAPYYAHSYTAGEKLKSNCNYWPSGNSVATNESGFSGLPGGLRNGDFLYSPYQGAWWTSTVNFSNNSYAYVYELSSSSSDLNLNYRYMHYGLSCRCVKESVPLITDPRFENGSIGSDYANGYYQIFSDGGNTLIEHGYCWSTSPNPTKNDNFWSVTGSGTGGQNLSIYNLTPATTYYVRSYAINSQGITYSTNVSFTTTN